MMGGTRGDAISRMRPEHCGQVLALASLLTDTPTRSQRAGLDEVEQFVGLEPYGTAAHLPARAPEEFLKNKDAEGMLLAGSGHQQLRSERHGNGFGLGLEGRAQLSQQLLQSRKRDRYIGKVADILLPTAPPRYRAAGAKSSGKTV